MRVCVSDINKDNREPTYKVELIGKDPEEGLTVQSEHDGEVGAQRAPHKHMVDNCPEACVKSDLHNYTHTQKNSRVAQSMMMEQTVVQYRGCELRGELTALWPHSPVH